MPDKLTPERALSALANGKVLIDDCGIIVQMGSHDITKTISNGDVLKVCNLCNFRIHHEEATPGWAEEMGKKGHKVRIVDALWLYLQFLDGEWWLFKPKDSPPPIESPTFGPMDEFYKNTKWELYTEPERAVGWYMAKTEGSGDKACWWDGQIFSPGPYFKSLRSEGQKQFTNIRPITIGEPER